MASAVLLCAGFTVDGRFCDRPQASPAARCLQAWADLHDMYDHSSAWLSAELRGLLRLREGLLSPSGDCPAHILGCRDGTCVLGFL